MYPGHLTVMCFFAATSNLGNHSHANSHALDHTLSKHIREELEKKRVCKITENDIVGMHVGLL